MEMEQTSYTKPMVAELLGVSESTVYNLARQGKLEVIPDPHRIRRSTQYTWESVHALMKERNVGPNAGKSIPQFAKEIGVHQSKIYPKIKELQLQVETVSLSDVKKQYYLPEDTQTILRNHFQHSNNRGSRSDFYSNDYDIALYQAFTSESGQTLRVTRNKELEWGFYLNSGDWIGYEEAKQEYMLQPIYAIHRAANTNFGYTDFIYPKRHLFQMDLLDTLYRLWGIENMRMKEVGDNLYLSLRSGEKKVPMDNEDKPLHSQLKALLDKGDVEGSHGVVHLISTHKRTTVDVPLETHDQLVAYAAEHGGMNIKDVISYAIKELLNR